MNSIQSLTKINELMSNKKEIKNWKKEERKKKWKKIINEDLRAQKCNWKVKRNHM